MALWQVLINSVAARCLWDISNADYKDTGTVWPNNWRDIAEEFKAHGVILTSYIYINKMIAIIFVVLLIFLQRKWPAKILNNTKPQK